MFFFIGGIQPRTVVLENRPESCRYCSHNMVRLKRTDQYLSVFFIPLIRVKKGVPYLTCDNCNALLDDSGGDYQGFQVLPHCQNCNAPLNSNYNYCPNCGKKLL